MPDRPARSLSSESGLIGVGAVIAIAIVALGIYLLVAAFEGDPAYYGSVPVPSEGAEIELDSGEVDVSYAEEVDTGSLVLPEDLTYSVRTADGDVLESSTRTGQPEDSDAGAAQLFSSIDVDEDGTYFVTVNSGQASGRAQPALAFGLSPTGAIEARLGDVIDALKGPAGIVVVVVLGLLLVIPWVQRTVKSRNRDRPDIYY